MGMQWRVAAVRMPARQNVSRYNVTCGRYVHRWQREKKTFHNWPLFRDFLCRNKNARKKSGRLFHNPYHPKGTAKHPEQDK